MSKITPEHLARQPVVYIRQSTPDQVVHNLESKRRQYNLPERARAPRTRRGHSGRGGRSPHRQPVDRATSDQGRPARGEPALQRGSLDHQSGRS
jgi:hypothetical protein